MAKTYYAKQFGEDGKITSLHSFTAAKFPEGNPSFVEMTEDEYKKNPSIPMKRLRKKHSIL